MIETTCEIPITSSEVGDSGRLAFMPRHLGARHVMRFEATLYYWMGRLCREYQGGLWSMHDLSNGGFYMAPRLTPRDARGLHLVVDLGNEFADYMSPDAAGIVATLFALGHLWEKLHAIDEGAADGIASLHGKLRSFAAEHVEAGLIGRAID